MEFLVLGQVEIHDDDGRIADLGGVRGASLTAALLAQRGQALSQDRLAEALWPGSKTARDNLQSYVSRVRRGLGPGGKKILSRTSAGYVLHSSGCLDAEEFEEALEAAAAALGQDPGRALDLARRALRLWRGPAFGEFAADELVHVAAARLEELRLVAEEQRLEAELALGRHRSVVGDLEALCAAHPLRERLWALQMLALTRSGRQAEALRAYQRARDLLAEELGIEPAEPLRRMQRMVLDQDPALGPPEPQARRVSAAPPVAAFLPVEPDLPAELTPFVGRAVDVEAVRGLLEQARLVTLTGIGGVGKTRLALRVARVAGEANPGGVGMAELAGVSDPSEVGSVIGDRLARLDPARPSLLLVDNCEHLIDQAAAVVAGLTRSRPLVRILATSREPLRLPGEVRWRVEPMSVPPADTSSVDLAEHDAAQLFLDRARALRPGLALDEAAMADVGAICRRLDGIPLAIELAAAKLGTMSIGQIRAGLSDRFDLLAEGYRTSPARQRTLGAAFDWSYDLLDDDEKRVLQALRPLWKLGFPRRAAEVICADDPADESRVGAVLGRLVDRSLVTMEDRAGRATYSILPTIADFVWRRTGWQGGFESRGFVVFIAQLTEPRLRGSIDDMWRALLDGPAAVARQALDLTYHRHDLEAGSFLAGVVAARTTATGRIGFVGGVRSRYIRRFAAGFAAGVGHVAPGVEVVTGYLSKPPDFSGFMNTARGETVAAGLFDRGVDVIFHATGHIGGHGVLEAARRWNESRTGRAWVIGVDEDEAVTRDPPLRPCVLTSMRRQVPTAVFRELKAAVAAGGPEAAPTLGLDNEGVGLSTTGGHIDHLIEELDATAGAIIAGDIVVPRVQPGRGGQWY